MFITKVTQAVIKKSSLFESNKLKYAGRAMFGGAFLTMTTAVGVIAADQVNQIHPILGRFMFPALFSWGLVFILFLNAELATSNMMFLTAGTFLKKINWQKSLKILLYCTFFNAIGALMMGYLFARTSAFQNIEATSFLGNGVAMRLARSSSKIILEGILTNMFVNIAVLSFILIKNAVTRLWIAIICVFMFVYLAQEHLVANFAAFGIAKFSIIADQIENFGWLNILRQWLAAFIGNYIGGGLLIGLVYAWLNKDQELYVD